MTIDRIKLKSDAKASLKAAKPTPYLATLIVLLASFVIGIFESRVNRPFQLWLSSRLFLYRFYIRGARFSFEGLILYVIMILALSLLSIGYMWYLLKVSRKVPSKLSAIFDAFKMPLKALGLYFLEGIFILLWSVLLIIPGIVAAYRYRLAFYILYDNPDYDILQCIRESKKLMTGYKTDLFLIDLTFIGWVLLCILTIDILFIWKMPYIRVTEANFYNALIAGDNQTTYEIENM